MNAYYLVNLVIIYGWDMEAGSSREGESASMTKEEQVKKLEMKLKSLKQ